MFSKLTTLLALSSTALAANHNIRVGPGLTFTPANTEAAVADTLTFTFAAETHDVVQGVFNSPCVPSTGAFYSGFLTPENNFVVTVNDTNPLYFFCSAGRHCQNGMVGGVNLPTTGSETLALYVAASAGAGASSQPANIAGGVVSPAGGEEETSASASASATGTTATSTGTVASATSSPSPTTAGNAGVAVTGNVAGVLGLGALLAAFLA